MLSDPVPCVLIPDRVRCPASARAHLLLLSNGSLAKCPLACQSVNILFFFFTLEAAAEAPLALPLHHLLCMRLIISWGEARGCFMAASDGPPHLQSACMARAPAPRATPPQGPGIFYSGASTARPLIYRPGEGRSKPPCAQPRPASKGPITYHTANAFPPSLSLRRFAFSLVNILRCIIYPSPQPGVFTRTETQELQK